MSSIVSDGGGETELASVVGGEGEEEVLWALVEAEVETSGAGGEGEGGLGEGVVDGCGADGDGREDTGLAATEADIVGAGRAGGEASY